MKGRILVVDDDEALAEMIGIVLRNDGFEPSFCADGARALDAFRNSRPDLVLLDLMLPGLDGIEVCRQIRGESDVPVVMLTAKSDTSDIVRGLESGADDYVPKPFSMRLLLARVRMVLRRAAADTRPRPVTRVRDLAIDDDRHEVRLRGELLQLTLTEYKLLRFLAQHPGRVFTRSQILNNIQDEHVIVIDRAIDVHVAALRRKLGDEGRCIETVRGVGYRFKE